MMPRASAANASRQTAVFLVLVLCSALLPLTAPVVSADGRDASIMVTAIPTSLAVNPGEAGEYTIRVRNTGSNRRRGDILALTFHRTTDVLELPSTDHHQHARLPVVRCEVSRR